MIKGRVCRISDTVMVVENIAAIMKVMAKRKGAVYVQC